MRNSDFTRASNSGWLIGLARKSSAPASMPLTRSLPGSSAVIITTGNSAVAGFPQLRKVSKLQLMVINRYIFAI